MLKLLLSSDSRMLMMGVIVPVEGKKVEGPWAHSIKQTLVQIKLSSSISVCGENSSVVFSCFASTLILYCQVFSEHRSWDAGNGRNGRVHDAKGKLFLMGDWRWLLALLHFVTICQFHDYSRGRRWGVEIYLEKCSDHVIVLTPVFDKNWCISKRLWSPHLPNTIQLDGSSRYFMKNIVANT